MKKNVCIKYRGTYLLYLDLYKLNYLSDCTVIKLPNLLCLHYNVIKSYIIVKL